MNKLNVFKKLVNRQAMVQLLILFLLAGTSFGEPDKVCSIEASRYCGEKVTVCGNIVQSVKHKNSTYLNFERSYPRNEFFVKIDKNSNENFEGYRFDLMLGKELCVNGKVVRYLDKYFIDLVSPRQIVFDLSSANKNIRPYLDRSYSLDREVMDRFKNYNDVLRNAEAIGLVVDAKNTENSNYFSGENSDITVLVLDGFAGEVGYKYNGDYAHSGELQDWGSGGGDCVITGRPKVGDLVVWFPSYDGYAYGWMKYMEPEKIDNLKGKIAKVAKGLHYSKRINETPKMQYPNIFRSRHMYDGIWYFILDDNHSNTSSLRLLVKKVHGDGSIDISSNLIDCKFKKYRSEYRESYDKLGGMVNRLAFDDSDWSNNDKIYGIEIEEICSSPY